jgi:hypothetical protein
MNQGYWETRNSVICMPTKYPTVRVRADTYAFLAQLAAREERKMSQIVDRAVRYYATGRRDLNEDEAPQT